MSILFSPISFRELTCRNRIFVSPMCQYSCHDGVPNDWHLVHLGSRAVGGAGLVMAEATAVCPEGRISPDDSGLWNDSQAEAFSRICRFIREQGAVPAVQLAHAGRKASVDAPWRGGKQLAAEERGWEPIAPSPLPFAETCATPTEATAAHIAAIHDDFAAAARRALTAGFQVVEIHMAHGYLLHQFLSPLTNQRRDEYGGCLENRLRLPLAVARTVRDLWPAAFPVFVRISASDWVEGGWDMAQSIELCCRLKELGIDLIDCSAGGLIPNAKMPVGPGFQTPFATTIRQQVGIATGTVGLITNPVQAEQIVATGLADVVFLARELLRNPYWPLQAAKTLGAEHLWPIQYERAK